MAYQEIEVGGWRYSLTETTEDKRTRRTGVSPGSSFEVAGFDGSLDGGLRPLSGFRRVHTLMQPGVVQPGDFFPVTIRVGADEYLSGFVYRYKAGSNYGVAFDYYYNGVWDSQVLAGPNASPGGQMDVMEFGRFLYVLRAGKKPILVYTYQTSLPGFSVGYFENTGPGPQPDLLAPDRVEAIGSFDSINNGQIILSRVPPEQIGLWGPTPAQTDDEVRPIDPGDYVFAFQWYNSTTGRRSSISVIAPAQMNLFADETSTPIDGGGSGDGSGSGEIIEVSFNPRYAIFEGTYDRSKYDQVILYRSVMVQRAGGTFVASILGLDGIYTLADFHTDVQPTLEPAIRKRVLIYYRLEDKQLVFTDWYLDQTVFDEDMPYAGAGIVYDGTALVSSIEGSTAAPFRGVGEIRWSALLEISVELFPPLNRYVPKNATDQVIRFVQVGAEVVGLSRNRVYFIRKEGGYIKVIETHDGYGAVSKMAVETVGSFVYYLSNTGMKAVDVQGQLDSVRAVNSLVVDDWAKGENGLANCSLAHDDQAKVMFLLNPDADGGRGRMVLFWAETSKVTEIFDATFTNVRRGHVPTRPTGPKRALFCDANRRVFVMDFDREKKISGSADSSSLDYPRISMLDFTGDTYHSVASVSDGGLTVNVGFGSLFGPEAGLKGAWVYILGGDRHGRSAQIVAVNSSTQIMLSEDIGIQAGDRLVVSPMVCQWVGPQIGLVHPDGSPMMHHDFFRSRNISSIGCAFSDVKGYFLSDAIYEGQVWRANDQQPLLRALPEFQTAPVLRQSVLDGPAVKFAAFRNPASALAGKHGVSAAALYPGVRILAADFDFILLGVQVRGKIEGTEQPVRTLPGA